MGRYANYMQGWPPKTYHNIGIMSLRATALWRANKPLVWVIWFSWACMVVTVTVCTVFTYFDQLRTYDICQSWSSTYYLLATVLFDPILGICTSSGATRIQFVLPALQASFVLGVTILTVLKAYQYPSPLRRLRDMSSIVSKDFASHRSYFSSMISRCDSYFVMEWYTL